MRDSQHDTGEMVQIILQNPQRADVEVVCRLVQNQEVRRAHQNPEQIEPSLLSSGQLADRCVLHGRRKQESVAHISGRDKPVRGPDIFRRAAHIVNDALGFVQRLIFLAEIADLHRFPDLDPARVRFHKTADDFEERGLAAAVRPDDPDAVGSLENVAEIPEQYPAAIPFSQMIDLHGLAAEARGQRTELHLAVLDDFVPVPERLKALNVRLLLGGPCPGAALHPRQILAVKRCHFPLRRGGRVEPLLFQLQKPRVVRVIPPDFSPVDLQNLIRDLIEEIAVVCDHQNRAAERNQKLLQPLNHLRVQMIGRLVENQQIRRRQNRCHQGSPLLLPAGQGVRTHIRVIDSELLQHGADLSLRIPVVCLAAHPGRNVD